MVAAFGAVSLVAGLVIKGAKARFVDEVVNVINKKFEDHEAVENAHDEAVGVAIAALKDDVGDLKKDVSTVRDDVREVARDLKKIMSNGHFKDVQF